MSLGRCPLSWASCYEDIATGQDIEPSPLYLLNQNILSSSSISSASSTRSLSPMTDDEDHYPKIPFDSEDDLPLASRYRTTSNNIIVNTAFDINLKSHKKFPGPSDHGQRLKWSAFEQELAAKAAVPATMENLQAKVSYGLTPRRFICSFLNIYPSLRVFIMEDARGMESTSRYRHIYLMSKSNLFFFYHHYTDTILRKVIRLNNSDGTFMSIVVGDMPASIRLSLHDALTTTLAATPGADLKNIDTSQMGNTPPKFPVLHFSCYNRNSTSVSCS